MRSPKRTPSIRGNFSLTEGENAVIPHWRFERLFQRRREERAAGPYHGGICYTMTPKLNQLTLFMAAQSFLRPGRADPNAVAGEFLSAMLGPSGGDLVSLLPLFEVIRDWGNYHDIRMPHAEYHAKLCAMRDILEDAAGKETDAYSVFPSPAAWQEEMLFFARQFADLSAPAPDYDTLHDRYWRHFTPSTTGCRNTLIRGHGRPRRRSSNDSSTWNARPMPG